MTCSEFVYSRRAGNWSLLCLPHNRNLISSKEVDGRSFTRQEEGVRTEVKVEEANLKGKIKACHQTSPVSWSQSVLVRSPASTGVMAGWLESQPCVRTTRWLFLAAQGHSAQKQFWNSLGIQLTVG